MHLKDLISTEYEKRGRNKPNAVILNHFNMLRVFLAPFCRNMNESNLTPHSRFWKSSMLSIVYENVGYDFRVLGRQAAKADWREGRSRHD